MDGRIERPRLLALFDRPRVRAALGGRGRGRARVPGRVPAPARVLAGGRVALVDLGWHGTIHKAVQVLATEPGGRNRPATTWPSSPASAASCRHRFGPARTWGDRTRPRWCGRSPPRSTCWRSCARARPGACAGSLSRAGLRARTPAQPGRPGAPRGPERAARRDRGVRPRTPGRPGAGPRGGVAAGGGHGGFLRLAATPTKEEAVQVGGAWSTGTTSGPTRCGTRPGSGPGPRPPRRSGTTTSGPIGSRGCSTSRPPQGAALRTLWWLMQD